MLTDPLLTTDHLAERWGVTRKHVTDRIVLQPDFPAPHRQLSQRLRWWRLSDIEAWEATSAQRFERRLEAPVMQRP